MWPRLITHVTVQTFQPFGKMWRSRSFSEKPKKGSLANILYIYIYIEEETKMGATCYVKDTVPDKLLKRLLYDFWFICIASDHSDLNYDPFLNFWLWLIKSKVDILLLKLINTVCYFTSNDERLPYCMKQKIVWLLLTEMKILFLSYPN